MIKKELALNKPLLKRGDVSLADVLKLERSLAEMEGQIVNRQNKYTQDLQTEFAKVEEDLVGAVQTLKQREAALGAVELIAPSDGIIKNVRLTTIGGVLRASDEVLQIVPTGEELIVEARVAPADIAYVRLGQVASVKFDAYDSSIYGAAVGNVSYISPDTLSEQRPNGEQIFYRVHIRVNTKSMRPRPHETIEMQPGMTAIAEIITGKNTVLRYLFKPIVKTMDESFGER